MCRREITNNLKSHLVEMFLREMCKRAITNNLKSHLVEMIIREKCVKEESLIILRVT